jgi:hypothetical protein
MKKQTRKLKRETKNEKYKRQIRIKEERWKKEEGEEKLKREGQKN